MDISVIIPSYKSENYILHCLESLHRQKTNASFEIIIVDSSPEDIKSYINSAFPNVKVLHLENQTFPGVARNIGVGESNGRILAFLDADCVADEGWIEKVAFHHKGPVQAIVGSVVNGRPLSILSQAEYFLEFREFSPFTKQRESEILVTANFSIRKELFQSLGGFSDHRAGEDTIFARVMREKGKRIFFYPGIIVFHMKYVTLGSFINNQLLLGTFSAIARKQRPELPGAFLTKPYFVPLLPIVRVARTFGFIAKYSIKGFIKCFLILLAVFPVFFLGACVWAVGFARGLRPEKVMIKSQS